MPKGCTDLTSFRFFDLQLHILIYVPHDHQIRVFVCIFTCRLSLSLYATMAIGLLESVHCFRRKKTAVVVTYYKRGHWLIKINGCPIEWWSLRSWGSRHTNRYSCWDDTVSSDRVNMVIRIKGGGHTSQIYTICQTIAKALVAYYQSTSTSRARRNQGYPHYVWSNLAYR